MRRVTVTLPDEVVDEIDRHEPNRSRFVLEATLDALERRQQEELRRSLDNPHPDSEELARVAESEWFALAGDEDCDLLDPGAGTRVRWVPGSGWVEVGR
jgi:Arc/MetJ-type ribon-helix-helix transcriptional regulator